MHSEDIKFYKYLNHSSAISVLKTQTLKWSSPHLFNDPFEFPEEFDFSFKEEDLNNDLLDELVQLVYGEKEPEGDLSHPLFAFSMITRRNKNKPSEQEFRDVMCRSAHEREVNFKVLKDIFRTNNRNLKENMAVFCVSKTHDDLLMWAHYAKDHTGCAYKLKCLPQYDRPLCAAREVSYQDDYPLIADISLYVKYLTGQINLDLNNLFEVFALTKSSHWSYEKEWRCVGNLNNKTLGYDFDPMMPEELESIYLGCRMEEETKKEILRLVEDSYIRTSVYQAKLARQKYALEFIQIR